MSKIDINDFEVEKECVYQREKYCVRDNGAALRYTIEFCNNLKVMVK